MTELLPLRALAYRSRACPPLTSMDLARIAAASRRNNALDGVTGVLVSDGDHIVQIVEGVPTAIDELMRRIRNDPRHSDVEVLYDRPTDRRLFADWNMRLDTVPPGELNPQMFDQIVPRELRPELRDALDLAQA